MNQTQRRIILFGVVLCFGWLLVLAPVRYASATGGIADEHRGIIWDPDGSYIEARDGYGSMVYVTAHALDVEGTMVGILVIGLIILGAMMLLPKEPEPRKDS